MPRIRTKRPIRYRDRQRRVWYVSEVARLKLVSAASDGPSQFLVIRFEREGEERFARWIGGDDWRERDALQRLFTEAEPVGSEALPRAPMPEAVEALRLWKPDPLLLPNLTTLSSATRRSMSDRVSTRERSSKSEPRAVGL